MHPANVVSVAAVVDVAVVNAMKPLNAASSHAQRAVPTPLPKTMWARLATKARPEKAVVRAAKVVETAAAMAEVVAMGVVPARMAKAAMPVVKTTRKPSWALQKRTPPPLLTHNR